MDGMSVGLNRTHEAVGSSYSTELAKAAPLATVKVAMWTLTRPASKGAGWRDVEFRTEDGQWSSDWKSAYVAFTRAQAECKAGKNIDRESSKLTPILFTVKIYKPEVFPAHAVSADSDAVVAVWLTSGGEKISTSPEKFVTGAGGTSQTTQDVAHAVTLNHFTGNGTAWNAGSDTDDEKKAKWAAVEKEIRQRAEMPSFKNGNEEFRRFYACDLLPAMRSVRVGLGRRLASLPRSAAYVQKKKVYLHKKKALAICAR